MPIALTSNPAEIRSLSAEFESASATEVLQWAFDEFGTQAAIGTSFQGAGLVTIHQALSAGLPVPVFTIDTGLLFPETLEFKARLESFFGISIEALLPELSVQQQAQQIAPELWTSNPDLCCTLRKVEPLQKKLVNSMPGLPDSVATNRQEDLKRRFCSFMNLIVSETKTS